MASTARHGLRVPARHSPDRDQPLASYAVLISAFFGLAGAFATWVVKSGRSVPDRVEFSDLALVSVAAHKAARLVAKDRVTSVVRAPFTRYEGDPVAGEVEDAPRGRGFRRALGEMLVCPYCLGMWIAGALTAGLLVVPRFTRWIAFALTALTIADFLQIAYKKAEDTL
jgi:hypothetical protein